MNRFGFGLRWVTYGLRVKHIGLPPGGFIPPVIQIQNERQNQGQYTTIRLGLDGYETNREKRARYAYETGKGSPNVKEPRVIRGAKIDGFGLKPWAKMVINNSFSLMIIFTYRKHEPQNRHFYTVFEGFKVIYYGLFCGIFSRLITFTYGFGGYSAF